MPKLLLAAVVAVSFVSVQANLQRVKGIESATRFAGPGQPTAPVPRVTLGSGTTRAIQKDRQFTQLDCGGTGWRTTVVPAGASPCIAELAVALVSQSPPSLHLRI
jgi:hypothetical protein